MKTYNINNIIIKKSCRGFIISRFFFKIYMLEAKSENGHWMKLMINHFLRLVVRNMRN